TAGTALSAQKTTSVWQTHHRECVLMGGATAMPVKPADPTSNATRSWPHDRHPRPALPLLLHRGREVVPPPARLRRGPGAERPPTASLAQNAYLPPGRVHARLRPERAVFVERPFVRELPHKAFFGCRANCFAGVPIAKTPPSCNRTPTQPDQIGILGAAHIRN